MSGPQYPPGPAPGSNAIGSFAIGESPVGTIKAFDQRRTIISQYANSPRMCALIDNFDAYVDQTDNIEQFYDLVWNIQTAQGWGLDVWGRIVGVSRILRFLQSEKNFGFGEAGAEDVTGFDQASFYAGSTITRNYRLADDVYRRLILAKAMANICDGSIPAINRVLMAVFPSRGNCYVTDGDAPGGPFFGFGESPTSQSFGQAPFFIPNDLQQFFFGFGESASGRSFGQAPFFNSAPANRMAMTYTFEFPLTALDVAIIQESGVLPKPSGVSVTVVQRF